MVTVTPTRRLRRLAGAHVPMTSESKRSCRPCKPIRLMDRHKNRYDYLKEIAFDYAFLLRILGVV